eukprot:g9173.t1
MKTELILCVLLVAVGVCKGQIASLILLKGTWSASVRNADFAVLTPTGVGAVCRDAVPPECEREVPNGTTTYTFTDSTLSQNYVHLGGITTREAAEALMPACAAVGIYPVEFRLQINAAQITSYIVTTRRLTFVDSRRPDDTNCILVDYRYNGARPIVNMRQRLTFQGTFEDVATRGASNRCDTASDCTIEANSETGALTLAFSNTYDLSCIAGACLN